MVTNYYDQLIMTLGYDPYEDPAVDPDAEYDAMKEEEAREYYENNR